MYKRLTMDRLAVKLVPQWPAPCLAQTAAEEALRSTVAAAARVDSAAGSCSSPGGRRPAGAMRSGATPREAASGTAKDSSAVVKARELHATGVISVEELAVLVQRDASFRAEDAKSAAHDAARNAKEEVLLDASPSPLRIGLTLRRRKTDSALLGLQVNNKVRGRKTARARVLRTSFQRQQA